MNRRIESLHLIEAALWQELARAAREREHGWRTMALATVDGEGADARSVILRETLAAERRLVFYTDDRSPKVAQIAAHPQATLLVWSSQLGWQLRLRVRLTVATTGLLVASRWALLKASPGAQDYLSPLAPGAPLVDRLQPERAPREHFAIVSAHVESVDWLELHPDGHRRAVFGHGGGHWVQP